LTAAGAGENVFPSKPGDRKVGGLRHFLGLQIDAELAEFDDRCSAPADRVGRERECERHPVRFSQRLAVAQDAVVARRRLDRKAHGLEATDELADVFPHLTPLVQSQHAKPVLEKGIRCGAVWRNRHICP
jgi:hypothetical protein